jgi:hypothetical protein
MKAIRVYALIVYFLGVLFGTHMLLHGEYPIDSFAFYFSAWMIGFALLLDEYRCHKIYRIISLSTRKNRISSTYQK